MTTPRNEQETIISYDRELDPFMGSVTTAKMAMLNSRNFIGFEISKDYCDIAIQRVKRYYKPLQETNTLSSIGKTTEGDD